MNKIVKMKKNTFSNYRAGDFLIRLKNISMAGKDEFSVSSTKLIHALAICLKEEGFLQDIALADGILTVKVARAHKTSVLNDLRLISKPGLRIYRSVDELKLRKARSSTLILSTPKGIMSLAKAIKNNTGGEVIAEVS